MLSLIFAILDVTDAAQLSVAHEQQPQRVLYGLSRRYRQALQQRDTMNQQFGVPDSHSGTSPLLLYSF